MRIFTVCICCALWLVGTSHTSGAEVTGTSVRMDFPITRPDRVPTITWIFQGTAADAEQREVQVLAGLTEVVNTGLPLRSVVLTATPDGFLQEAEIITAGTSAFEQSTVRLMVVWYNPITKTQKAPSALVDSFAAWGQATTRGLAYETFIFVRDTAPRIGTMIAFYCVRRPCPGKYPIVAQPRTAPRTMNARKGPQVQNPR